MGRTFGVEIECGHPDGPSGVASILRQNGCSSEWRVGADGSGVEARTPVLEGRSGFKEFKKGMNLIRETGGYVTRRDGLHVHHGAPEVVNDRQLAARLIESWYYNTPLIEGFVAGHRCGRSAYNPPWTHSQVQQLKTSPQFSNGQHDTSSGTYDPYTRRRSGVVHYFGQCGPRGAINLHSLARHGTVELRLFEGTLDYGIAEAWVKFGQRFLNAALKRKSPLPRASDGSELLKRLRVGKQASERLLAKAGGSYTDLTFQSF